MSARKPCILVIVILLANLAMVTVPSPCQADGYEVSAQVPVGPYPMGIAVAPQSGRAYVASPSGYVIHVVAPDAGAVAGTIAVTGGPRYPVLSPCGTKLLAPLTWLNGVAVISTATNSVLGVSLPLQPSDVAMSSDGRKAYVSSYGAHVLSIVSLEDYNTPVGLNVNVPLLPGLSVTFAEVVQRGNTTGLAVAADLTDGPFYGLCEASVAYSIGTTAAYVGHVDVHITYNPAQMWPGDEYLIRILQRQGAELVDITSHLLMSGNMVTGRATELGEFMLVVETVEGTARRVASRIAELLMEGGQNPFAAFWLGKALVDLQGAEGGTANNGALDKFADGDLVAGMTKLIAVIVELKVAALFSQQASGFLEVLAYSAASYVRHRILEAQAVFGNLTPSIQWAWAQFNQGMALLAHSTYPQAVTRFRSALAMVLELNP